MARLFALLPCLGRRATGCNWHGEHPHKTAHANDEPASLPVCPPRRVSSLTRQWTYAELMQSQFGRGGALLLQWSIVVNNAGTMTVYLIIIGIRSCCSILRSMVGPGSAVEGPKPNIAMALKGRLHVPALTHL